MKQLSKRDKFYREVGEAMSMGDSRCFINNETLKVDIHASEEYFDSNDMEDSAEEATNNPEKFLLLKPISSRDAFETMEAFINTVKNKYLQNRLMQAIDQKKPFANFKKIIDNSIERQNWFDFRDKAYAEIAKEWLEDNASNELLQKIGALPIVFIVE